MGNFLQILSGFAKGAAGTYSKQSEEERKTKADQDALLGKTLLERSADPDLTPEEAQTHLDTALDYLGMDKKTKATVLEGSKFIRAKHDEDMRRQQVADTGGTPTPSPATGGPEVAPAMPVPGQQKSLGDIPSRTMGDIQYAANRPRQLQEAQDKSNIELDRQSKLNQLQRENQRVMASGELQDKLDLFQKYKGTELENEARQMLGMAPRTSGASGILSNFTMSGKDVKAKLIEQGNPQLAQTIDESKYYRPSFGADRHTITDAYSIQSPAISSKAVAMDAGTAARYGKDKTGNPLIPGQMYVPLHGQLGGDVVGFIPETEVGSISQHPDIKVVTDADGNQRLEITPVTTTTQRTANGGVIPAPPPTAPGPAGPTGQLPGFSAPPTGATPASPTGQIPSLPVNVPPKANAGAGPTTSRDLNVKKPLNPTEFQALNGAQEGLNKINSLTQMLKDNPNLLLYGAIPGTPGARTYDRFKKEMVDIISRLRTGAVINEQEETFYKSQLPGLADAASEKFFGEKDAIKNALDLHKALFQRVVDQFGGRSAKPGAFGNVPSPGQPNPKGGKPSLNDIFGGKK